jgi:truncated hemoglobin YjbI
MPAKAGSEFERNERVLARLGGRETIAATGPQFYERVLADSELKPFSLAPT